MFNFSHPKLSIISQYIHEGKYIFLNSLLERFSFFAVFVLLARIVTKDLYGIIVTSFAFANILNSFFEFGFPFYIQRESATGNTNLNYDINSIIKFKSYCLVIFILIIELYFYKNHSISILAFLIIALSVYISGFNTIFNSLLLGNREYKESFNALFIARCILLLTFLLFFYLELSPIMLLIPFLLSSLVHLSLLFSVSKKNNYIYHNNSFDLNNIKKIFKSSIPIGLGLIFVWLYDRIDILLVQRMIDLSAVASYAVAYSLYKIPQIISGTLLVPAFTNFSQSYARTHCLKFDDIIKLSVLLLIISILFIITILYSSDSLIIILYGTKYKSSIGYLKILAFAIPGIYLNNFTGVISNSIRKEKIPLLSTGIGVFICIIMNIILIPVIGIWSAVYTTITVEYVVFMIQLVLLIKYFLNNKNNLIWNLTSQIKNIT